MGGQHANKNKIKSADLACEFHGVISEPGPAKTLAWPGGAGVALPGKGEGGRGGEGGVHAFLLGGPRRSGQSSGHKVLCLKIEK